MYSLLILIICCSEINENSMVIGFGGLDLPSLRL